MPALTARPREATKVLTVLAAYFGARLLVEGDPESASHNADVLLDLERRLGLDVERAVQASVLGRGWAGQVLSAGYVWLHWPLLIAAMTVLTVEAPHVQARLRRAIAASALVGVVLFAVVPMAPPRFMPGFTGTVSDAARRHYLPYPMSWTNQFAAFPSYHVGWTLIACIAVAGLIDRRWVRAVAYLPAGIVAVAVVATGNHYVLDSLAGAALAVGAWWLPTRPREAQTDSTVTVPLSPSTRTIAPSGIRAVAPVAATTHGRPSSRDTITAWLIWPPTSTTTASTGTNNGVHDGSVSGAMRTSPGPMSPGSPGSVTILARPSATPAHPAIPERCSPGPSGASAEASVRSGQVSAGGISPSNTNGGTRRDNSSRTRRRSAMTSRNDAGSSA